MSDLPSDPPTSDQEQKAPIRKNARTPAFKNLFKRLPDHIKKSARRSFQLFVKDPGHPSLRLHRLIKTKKSRLMENSFSVSINMQYRAIFFDDGKSNVWYWVGSHSDYDQMTGSR